MYERPCKSHVFRFGRGGKLAPRFVGPFEVLERIGPVAYRLALPPQFENLHDVFFHASMLRRYLTDSLHELDWPTPPITSDMSYEINHYRSFDRKEQVFRSKTVLVKVPWQYHGVEEATWEPEDVILKRFPFLGYDQGNIQYPNILAGCPAV